MWNKLTIFGKDRKKHQNLEKNSAERGHVWKESGITNEGSREVEVGTLLQGNDKNNVIADKVLSCFYCLSAKFKVYVASFGTK